MAQWRTYSYILTAIIDKANTQGAQSMTTSKVSTCTEANTLNSNCSFHK